MDLLAENILKERIESLSFAWADGQRDAVISAMEEYHNKKSVATEDSIKILISDIVKLKNFVTKHKPSPYGRHKTIEAHEQYKKELGEWDQLMRL